MVVEHRSVVTQGRPGSEDLELHGHGVRLFLDPFCGSPRCLADLDVALVRRNAHKLVGVDNWLEVGLFGEQVAGIHFGLLPNVRKCIASD